MTDNKTLLLVGCGRMGGALLSTWRKKHPAGIKKFWVIEPHLPVDGTDAFWVSNLEFLPSNIRPSVIVFAVKPQILASVLPAYEKRFGIKPLYVSIAAGKTLAFFVGHLGSKARIVRVMPNTPALVGQAMSALCAAKGVSAVSKKIVTELMGSVGKTTWIKDEKLMDAVTAISGSGPAYVFLFLDSLTKAAIASGLDADTARLLAIQTVMGSCALAGQQGDSFESLIEQVTSPGGTTEAALKVLLDESRFEKLVKKAIKAAVDRSKIL